MGEWSLLFILVVLSGSKLEEAAEPPNGERQGEDRMGSAQSLPLHANTHSTKRTNVASKVCFHPCVHCHLVPGIKVVWLDI